MSQLLLRRLSCAVVATAFFAGLGGSQALAGDEGESPLVRLRHGTAPAGLDPRLADVAAEYGSRGAASALAAARRGSLRVNGDTVEVVVEAERGRAAPVRSALAARGATVTRSYADLTKAFVPVGALASLPRIAGVRMVEPPQRAYPTAVTGQGVAASNASFAHADGDRGAGVKVGIVDVGFFDYAALQAQGDLPATVTTHNLCTDFERSEHGAAVAEIVHEVAPEAELHLICIEDIVDFGLAKDYAVANGIKILNLSAGFYNTSRGDGSGGPATPDGIVEAGRNAGIFWVVSAGNEAESHWSGTFSGGANTFHDFATGDEGIGFTVPSDGDACVFLKWDAWPTTTTQDFDLGIFDASTSALVAASAEDQEANNTSPTEAACVTAPAGGKQYFVAIDRWRGTAPRLDLFVVGATFDEYRVAAGSLLEPASAPEALAVGAICWSGGGLEPYSSQGPTIDTRIKPDLAGFDSTSSASYGPFGGCGTSGFAGTSAAAPHVAGAAAILQQQEGPLTPAQLQARLEAMAMDLGAAGKDNAFGSGRLRLPAPPQASTASAQAVGRRVARLRGFVTPNRWPGTYRWEYSTDPTFASFSRSASSVFAAGESASLVSLRVDGLEPVTTYHARFVVENEHGSATGSPVTFTTLETAAPYVSVSDPSGVTSAGATLHGIVNPNGLETTYRFWYGTTFPPATATEQLTLTGDSSEPVAVTLSGLSASRTYAYRLVATSSAGTSQVDGFFQTQAAAPPAPAPPPSGGGGGSGGGGSGGGGPDLDVAVGHGPAAVAAGDTFTYTFVVRNKAAAKASDVALTFGVPAALELLSTYAEKGPGCSASGGQAVCPLVFLDGLQSTRVVASVRVRANGQVSTTASVKSSETDLNAADNQVTYTFTAGSAAAPVAPPAPPPTQVIPPAGVTKTGSPSADTMYGADGPDTLRGLAGPDRLFGRGGSDRLLGGAGNDYLAGGLGRDVLEGGPGNDTIVARDKTVDTIRCGRGRDKVIADRKDRVARDCEVVRRG